MTTPAATGTEAAVCEVTARRHRGIGRAGGPPMSPHYGCFNRAPFIPVIELRDHRHHDRVVSSWPHVTAKDCQYTLSDLGAVDARCEGCKHKVPNSPETKPQ